MVGAFSAQFPEFSQQYVQRLGGAVDELRLVATDFDQSTRDAGLTRNQALAHMTGTAFLDNRRCDMTRTFERVARLESDLIILSDGSSLTRLVNFARFRDRDIAGKVLVVFQPALPLTFAGLGFALGGYVLGWGFLTALSSVSRRRQWFQKSQA